MSDIKQLDSKVVYQNRWMTVREDKILRPSGAEGIYGVVDKPDCAAILAIDNGMIHLVQQYRYTVGQRCWEIPQGAWESNPDADRRHDQRLCHHRRLWFGEAEEIHLVIHDDFLMKTAA